MEVKGNHPLADIIANRLTGIKGVSHTHMSMMVIRACRDAVDYHQSKLDRIASIAGNPHTDPSEACRLIIKECE